VRWFIIIGILAAIYLATSIETYATPSSIPIGAFDPIEFWVWSIDWFGNQIPIGSIAGLLLLWIGLRMRRGLDDEREFRRRQRELGIIDEWNR
jgi:hypothetical protein